MGMKEETKMINDYIDRQLAKTKDADLRIQEQLDLIYELSQEVQDGTMDSDSND
jgi:hypothetical protein